MTPRVALLPMMVTALGVLATSITGCARHAPAPPTRSGGSHCLADGSGYLRLRADGALPLELSWSGGDLECDGEPRPDRQGLRLTFATRQPTAGHRPRLVIGLEASPRAGVLHAVPANVTLILEGEHRLFSTRGDDRCTIDELQLAPAGSASGHPALRVSGRGFCASPAESLGGGPGELFSRFDFAGRMVDAEPDDQRE